VNWRIPIVVAALTLRESVRRRVVWAVVAMTLALLALSGWGFHRIGNEFDTLTTGEAMLVTSQVLNLVLFGMSLIAALGTAFLAGPTLAGEIESGMSLAMLARPVRRAEMLLGKWLGLAVFGSSFIVLAGTAQLVIVRITTGYWPPSPVAGLALLAAQTAVLLTLGLLLATAVSPMASGIVAVGLFGATWIAGVVGGVGEALDNDGVARVGTVSRVLVPTDGLWRGAMHGFQHPGALAQLGLERDGFPFLADRPLSPAYLGWVIAWVVLVGGLTLITFQRRDL
jgi:ABC-type transport system involved in multi-copper enzyme maturation permease subunit